MARNRALCHIAAALALLLAAETVGATTVEEIIAIVDKNLTKVQDQTYDAEIKVLRDGKVTKSMSFTAKLKGLQMKLIKFTAPGDVRGMTVLTTSDGLMYVYLPSYKRVRRVASHVRNQGFMGTDLSAEDMGSASLSVGWDSKLDSEDAASWYLTVTPKAGNETSYSKLKVAVDKKYGGISKMEYYTLQGKLAKTQARTEWKTFGPLTVPTLFTVTDHVTGSKTEMRFSGCQVNTGIPESEFTKRAILRAD